MGDREEYLAVVKKRVDFRKMSIVAALMFLTAAVVSGSTWVFMSLAQNNISNTNRVEITNLENQVEQLREAVKSKERFEDNNQALGEITAN